MNKTSIAANCDIFRLLTLIITPCPNSVKSTCYKALVRPVMEYGSMIWDPYTQENIHRLEMVQRRSARFVTGKYKYKYSVTPMLEELGWPTLQDRRAQSKLTMMFRITNDLVDVNLPLIPAGRSLRGHSNKFVIPHTKSAVYQKSFLPDTIRMWNSLPQEIAESNSLNIFKGALKQHFKDKQ